MTKVKIAVLALLAFSPVALHAQATDPAALLQRLQDADSTDAAFQEMRAQMQKNTELREALIPAIPLLIAKHKDDDEVRANEIRLAGELKLIACIPELVAIFMQGDQRGGGITLSMLMHLRNDPAGRALIQIGDPVIPSLKPYLNSEKIEIRDKAIKVFVNIGSPAALDCLKEHRISETDRQLQHIIDSQLVAGPNK